MNGTKTLENCERWFQETGTHDLETAVKNHNIKILSIVILFCYGCNTHSYNIDLNSELTSKDDVNVNVVSRIYFSVSNNSMYIDSLSYFNGQISTIINQYIKGENDLRNLNSYELYTYEFKMNGLNRSFNLNEITVTIDSISTTIIYDNIFLKYKERIEKAYYEIDKAKKRLKDFEMNIHKQIKDVNEEVELNLQNQFVT